MNLISLFFYLFFILVAPSPILTGTENLISIKNSIGGIFFVASTNVEDLRVKYSIAKNGDDPIRILIVPGHDNSSVGAQFRKVKESDLTVELAGYLAALFSKEKEFETIPVRTRAGYAPQFASYFSEERAAIKSFAKTYRAYTQTVINAGLVTSHEGVAHNDASEEGAIKLYGVNKWANENQIDFVLHIHFNDHGGRPRNRVGKYSGFSIYIPERQYSNAGPSAVIAKSVLNRLITYAAPSDMPQESAGIIEDQGLIAVGSNNSLNPASILIEYDYIYEPQFQNSETRYAILNELAFQTYLGIKDFFAGGVLDTPKIFETTLLPHAWNRNMEEGLVGSLDVLSLQAALLREGVYPPSGSTKNDCPITGSFGKCTIASVKEFQKKNGIEPATGYVGTQTRKVLNEKYGTSE